MPQASYRQEGPHYNKPEVSGQSAYTGKYTGDIGAPTTAVGG